MGNQSAHWRIVVASGMLILIAAMSFLAPWLAPNNPRETSPAHQLLPPSRDHPFGTDLLGRDVFSRVIHGGQRTLGVALLTVGITLVPGALIGLLAGYAGRWLDWALMSVMDALLAFPSLLLALALVTVLGSGAGPIALAVGMAGIPTYARVVRAAVLEARTYAYVEAAQALGARPTGILWRHVVPATASPLLSFGGVMLSWAILNSAALMFLGYGGDISAPDWGVMLADGRQAFRSAPWVGVAPGIALSLTVFALNVLATSLATPPTSR